jgi:LacI family transcriptional regulator
MGNISIKDIARITGVSTATVSRVINNNGRFSEETRQKVNAAIAKLGYRSNVVAKSLRTMRSLSIGVIVPDITNEFFSKIVLGIEKTCFPKGYSVYICNTSENKEAENKYLLDLEAKGVDGLVHLSGGIGDPSRVFKRFMPMVCIDREPFSDEIPVVESDNYQGGYLAGELLVRHGCKNIAVLRDHRELSTMRNRMNGFQAALHDNSLSLDSRMIHNLTVDFASAKKCVEQMVDSKVQFDGIFAATDWLAVGALSALKEKEIHVPGQVKLVGFDNTLITEYISPSITTVNQDKFKMGEVAAQMLLELIADHTKKFDNVILPVEIVERETT